MDTPTSLGIQPIALNSTNLPDTSILTVRANLEISHNAVDSSEIFYDFQLDAGSSVTIHPSDDIMLLIGSEIAPLVNMELIFVNLNNNVYIMDGTLKKAGPISEGDFLTQISIFEGGVSLGQLPFDLDFSVSSQQVDDLPTVKVLSLLTYV